MTTEQLFAQFTRSINWNAFLYITYKILFTTLSFLLIKTLTTNDFAAWANINSTIFILLLWLDFGLRKSVPRFSPEFAQSTKTIKKFIIGIITFQSIVLMIGIPITYFCLNTMAIKLHQPITTMLTFGIILFIAEGIIATIQLIYHSYFLHKYFNLLAVLLMTSEMILNTFIIYSAYSSSTILYAIITNKIIINSIIIVIGSIMLVMLIPKITTSHSRPAIQDIRKRFVKHSAAMWVNTNIKSISERNFLVPFLTLTVGPGLANLFKVANDAAMLFYRIVIKTIGTTDTSLLAYAEMTQQKNIMNNALEKLATKITGLSLPLLGVIGLIALQQDTLFNNHFVFHAFIIMAGSYLIETMLIPFERMLEIKGRYWYLYLSYAPYICLFVLFLNKNLITSIDLLNLVGVIQSVRLVSMGTIMYIAHYTYNIPFPFHFVTLRVLTYCLAMISIGIMLIYRTTLFFP